MSELIDTPEDTEESLLVEDLTKKVFSNFANKPGSTSHRTRSIETYGKEHPELDSDQILDDFTKAYLYTKSGLTGQVERKESKGAVLQLVQELLGSVESSDGVIDTKDFALLHECFEAVAKTSSIFQDKEPNTLRFTNQLIDRYVQSVREFILKDPSGGDLLSADT